LGLAFTGFSCRLISTTACDLADCTPIPCCLWWQQLRSSLTFSQHWWKTAHWRLYGPWNSPGTAFLALLKLHLMKLKYNAISWKMWWEFTSSAQESSCCG